MLRITKIRVLDNGKTLKERHCDILTDDLGLKRLELRRQYRKEYGKKVDVHFTYRDGDGNELMNDGEE